jgi:hypothetical protein
MSLRVRSRSSGEVRRIQTRLTKAGGRRQKAGGCFCNGDLCPAPKTFRLLRRGFRPDFFDKIDRHSDLAEFILIISCFKPIKVQNFTFAGVLMPIRSNIAEKDLVRTT